MPTLPVRAGISLSRRLGRSDILSFVLNQQVGRAVLSAHLVPTDASIQALIFLKTMSVFSVAIKIPFVVALWAADLTQFCHEDSSPFWGYFTENTKQT